MITSLIYLASIILLALIGIYFYKQIKLSNKIALKDTTLENIEEKLKKHKLVGGRHKRTNKKNPPIV
ncbi:MAG: hypothetical protein HOG46_01165 [Gammaproteobacteria bacterium]|jgi:hypothetical protein|nr:hypothetical protein [Gammaproteobacteria bacterium]MBT5644454.1 hypothetical protein [Gammaproteobacteria bacterium]MBT5863604.1 hypothetical protein [Gammaproteobacteria bacterium]MBT6734011.1 hypothetical protein [Gammaproteobacteria bacterium]MBT7236060.1 hypothetical protein [Gammaproteobacteria bacterium]|tara:strand:+ start:160 stop:360 length:201 start_codon:yes stop_codon:yes gene_type:complete